MRTVNVLKALAPIDARGVLRDPMLRWMVLLPLLIAAVIRWGVPVITGQLLERLEFDLTPYYSLVMSAMLLLMPALCGMIIGFLLLDQRDDQTLTALQVTPLTLNGYIVYRITVPLVLSIIITMILFSIANLVQINSLPLLLASLLAAPLAPIYALFLATFAENKVQGFALAKAAGAILWPPLFAYFIDSRWRFAFGILPTYWPMKFFWMLPAGDSQAWIYFVLGLIYQLFLLWALLRRFNRVIYR
ncbi:MAG: hypothetical protein ACE5IR_15585 [bacterium]